MGPVAPVNAPGDVLTGPMAQDIALVTGASSGIGEALARRIARDGRHVALVARRKDRLEALAADLRTRHRIETHVLPTDLTATGAVRDLSAMTTARGVDPGSAATRGTPSRSSVGRPPATSALARSVAPVKSSATQPSSSMRFAS